LSFTRANPSGFALGDIFTSAQCNQMDQNISNALDKSVAGDAVRGVISFILGGQINANQLGAIQITAPAGLTVSVAGGLLSGVAGGIQPGVAGGIQSPIAGGIQGTVANAIQGTVAGGISAAVIGGIKPGVVNGIVIDVAGGLISVIAQGILSTVAQGIQGIVAHAIQATAASAIESLVPGGITLSGGATDNPVFNPPRTRTLTQWLTLPATLQSGWSFGALGSGNTSLVGTATGSQQVCPIPITHNGATLLSVTVKFAVGQAHTSVPNFLPSILVDRVPLTTGLVPTSLGSGFQFFPTPGTGALWYASGGVQSLVYTCTGNNIIDNTQYLYRLTLQDENGANSLSGNTYYGVVLSYGSIADSRFSI
jgi:hypothetical protein